MDLEDADVKQVGCIPDEEKIEPCQTTLRLTLEFKGAKRAVILQHRTFEELLEIASKKFGCSIGKVRNNHGVILDEGSFKSIPQDQVLYVSK